MDLLLSMDGRINRRQFWIGVIIVLVVAIVLGTLIGGFVLVQGGLTKWLGFLLSVLLLYPMLAISTKRLRDRGRNPVKPWLILYFAPGIVVNFAQTAGIGFQTISLGGVETMAPNWFGSILIFVGFVVFVVALIDLGIMKGVQDE